MSAPFTDLTALAAHLRELAQAHQPIVLDDSILAAVIANAITDAFTLPAGQHLTVAGVVPADIGEPAGGVLTVSTGTASVLRLDGVSITLGFWIAAGVLQLSVTATMPSGWAVKDSFAGLALFPFDSLAVSDARFVYGSVEQPAFEWPGVQGTTVDLQAGQNLLCQLGLGEVPLVAGLLGPVVGQGGPLRCHGPFAPTAGQPLPVGTLTASIDSSGFSLGSGADALSLTDPRVAVRIGTADDDTSPLQEIDLLVLGTFQRSLEVSVSIPIAGGLYRVETTPLPSSKSITALIRSLPGGASFTDYIPSELSSVFDTVGLDNFAMALTTAPAVSYLGLSVSTLNPWPLITDVLVLDKLRLLVDVVDPTGLNWTSVRIAAQAEFLPQVFPGEFDITVELAKQASWEVDTVSGAYRGAVNLGDLVAALLGSHDSVPSVLRDITFVDFGIDATRPAASQPFDYVGHGTALVALPLLDTELTAQLTVVFSRSGSGHAVHLAGALAVGDELFGLHLDLGTTGSLLTATWTDTGAPLNFSDIAATFGWTDVPTLPGGLDLALTGAGFSYDFTTGALVLTARSKHYGQLVLASSKVASQRVFLLDLTVPLNVRLTDIPVAGPAIPSSVDVGIQQLEIAYATHDYPGDAVTALDATLKALGGEALGYPSLKAGMVFVANLRLGEDTVPLTLSFGPSNGQNSQNGQQRQLAAGTGTGSGTGGGAGSGELATTPAPGSGPPAPHQGSGTWFDVGKTLGPVRIERIGIEYAHETLIFSLDADIAIGPLALSLLGLGVGSSLKAFSPVFSLSGLGLSYNNPPVQIAGAVLRVPDSQLAPGVRFQYDGMLVVKAEEFSIAALGSWAQLVTGMPSLFVFAQLEAPLGGPPFFFVTGLMGGFGFNRSLAVPGQDEVAGFPLLALAAAPPPNTGNRQDPTEILGVLEGTKPLNGVTKAWITPKAGEYWLAAGLEFTSFELVNTRALLVAEFGHEFALALLGLSTLRLPLAEANTPAYAYVEMMIRVVVQPSQGLFAATAVLSRNSYVLTPDCHLTGGFAFYLWFGDNPAAGQFVLTLGGYHPAFQAPSYFPQVPRLGFNWAVSDVVSVKGGSYFALTSSCAMAGGGLEVLFHDGDLKAWFTAQADFLISWHPFFFTADIAITIGASYRLNLLFCHKTVTVSLGAALHLWGPPTGGIVRVDLVLVSFSVRFGSDGAGTETRPLAWEEFTALLPAGTDLCGIAITDGLYKTSDAPENDSGKLWIVRAGRLVFQTRSAIPASELSYAGRTVRRSDTAPDGIAIRPMNLTGLVSVHTLSLHRDGSTGPADVSDWSLEPLTQTVPASLWADPPVPFSQIPAQPSADVLAGELCGFSVTAPLPQLGDSRGVVPVQLLMEEYLSPPGRTPLSASVAPSPDYVPTSSQQTVGLLQQVNTGTARQNRAALFGVLAGAALSDGDALFAGVDGDLAGLAAGADHLFSDPPLRQG